MENYLLRRPGRAEIGVERQAAVDKQGLAGDIGGVIGGQEGSRPPHLVGLAGPPHGNVFQDHMRMRFPVGARARAIVPPPAPLPMMMTSYVSDRTIAVSLASSRGILIATG